MHLLRVERVCSTCQTRNRKASARVSLSNSNKYGFDLHKIYLLMNIFIFLKKQTNFETTVCLARSAFVCRALGHIECGRRRAAQRERIAAHQQRTTRQRRRQQRSIQCRDRCRVVCQRRQRRRGQRCAIRLAINSGRRL